jgi:TonB dependent receptor
LPRPVTWTFGFSYDHFEQGDFDLKKPNPKFGVQWNITDDFLLRAAAFRTVKNALVVNQTIEPTQIAGFNQFFDDFNGTEAWRYGIGLDARLTAALYAGVEASRRDIDAPISFPETRTVRIQDWDEDSIGTYLYWAPHRQWALTMQYRYDWFKSDESPIAPQRINTHAVPLALRYFNPWGYLRNSEPLLFIKMSNRAPTPTLKMATTTFFRSTPRLVTACPSAEVSLA